MSGAGNLASILDRTTAHRRAVYAVLPDALTRGHHGSPAAAAGRANVRPACAGQAENQPHVPDLVW